MTNMVATKMKTMAGMMGGIMMDTAGRRLAEFGVEQAERRPTNASEEGRVSQRLDADGLQKQDKAAQGDDHGSKE